MLKALKRDRAFYGYLLRLTGPIALQNLITFSLGLIDTLMVSQLGNNEMAAVTAANVPVFLLISIVFGVQSGVGILISQYWGKKDLPSISRAIGVAAGLGMALALVIALALFLWPVQIMDLMSNKHHLSLLGAPYLRVIGFSYVFNMLSSIYVSAQRSVENASFGMKLFGMSTVLNTGMNYLLIFGKCGFPMLGVEGAAIATLLSRVAEFAVCLFCALRSRVIPLDLKALFRPGWEMLRRFVKYASPVMAGIDISKPILRLAAKREKNVQFAVASSYRLPAADGSVDLLINCFSPLAIEEFRRVLRPGGHFIYVVPGEMHLWEMKQVLYDHPYVNEVKETPYEGFRYVSIRHITDVIHLEDPADIQALFGMTPYCWKTPKAGVEKLCKLTQLDCRIAFDIHVFEKER